MNTGDRNPGTLIEQEETYLGYNILVTAQEVEMKMGKPNVIVIDARREGYMDGHIPFAIPLDWIDFKGKDFILKPVSELETKLGYLGLERDMNFFVYGEDTADVHAARIFWMLEYLGCTNVQLLLGGWNQWQADSRPIEKQASSLPVKNFKGFIDDSKIVSKIQIMQKLDKENFILLDARTYMEYIGWDLHGKDCGGHITGAIHFPYTWGFNGTGQMNNLQNLQQFLDSKGITSDKDIVMYSNAGARSCSLYFLLRLIGYQHIAVYDGSMAEWIADGSLPMEKLMNYSKIVYPEWVKELLEGGNPPTYSGHGYRILEVSFGEPRENNYGHIPTSIHLDTNEIESEPLWNIVSPVQLEKLFKKLGITVDTTVILYGHPIMAATRAALVLMYAGVKDVRLLADGLKGWVAKGYQVERVSTKPMAADDFGGDIPVHPEYLINTSYLKTLLKNKYLKLVDVRNWDEYVGEISGYKYVLPKGRIAGAAWGHAGSDPHHMEDYENPDGTIRSYSEIASMWREWGIIPNKRTIFYCGTGWRASLAFFIAYLMGWPNIGIYDGGWFEWSQNRNHAVENGDPRRSV